MVKAAEYLGLQPPKRTRPTPQGKRSWAHAQAYPAQHILSHTGSRHDDAGPTVFAWLLLTAAGQLALPAAVLWSQL